MSNDDAVMFLNNFYTVYSVRNSNLRNLNKKDISQTIKVAARERIQNPRDLVKAVCKEFNIDYDTFMSKRGMSKINLSANHAYNVVTHLSFAHFPDEELAQLGGYA
ncbi:MAG: hypothetical protein DRP42_05390 [Tenericutes bacterium]|nr:MAG: hypothetical protein DRP42_05390 [Mycoplasmatota bacterium]